MFRKEPYNQVKNRNHTGGLKTNLRDNAVNRYAVMREGSVEHTSCPDEKLKEKIAKYNNTPFEGKSSKGPM